MTLKYIYIGASPITAIYGKKKLFKNTYHLYDVRFAVNLWEKQPGETDEFRRCDDMQYISEISTEDRKRMEKT